jgi:hypothetical protein
MYLIVKMIDSLDFGSDLTISGFYKKKIAKYLIVDKYTEVYNKCG